MNNLTQDEWLASWLQDGASFLLSERSEPQGRSMLGAMLSARKRAKLSQHEVAKRMSISAPAVCRLERALLTGSPSPSIRTLQKYAKAVGKRVDVRLV